MVLIKVGVLELLYCASYYAQRCGRSSFGNGCGIFYIDLRTLNSNAGWICGAALSFILHIILIVVVVLALVPIVACSLLMGVLLFLVLAGLLALLYIIASYYPRRGGTSGDGVFCGIYYTDYSGSDSIIRWFIGAALS